ncbi:MAG TPA: hypothetical protein PLK46_11375 [Propioniciclava sp.]|uniref:hypothetical protein n=2 Tax=Actinomycetes TaxID=1760 RepID=UPI002B9605B3|nr:hypothetical protein [Propioniciclava sp.]HRL80917.1 hypothetical protein [Propioniciclava sp.]
MTHRDLTPYDTGDRLEPQLWPTGEADTFGRVDFDDDESRTVATAYIAREGSAYVLHVVNPSDALTVASDHGRVLALDEDSMSGIEELLSMAARGRADFEHQASYGDYTAEDRAEADRRWVLAQAAAETLRTHTTR